MFTETDIPKDREPRLDEPWLQAALREVASAFAIGRGIVIPFTRHHPFPACYHQFYQGFQASPLATEYVLKTKIQRPAHGAPNDLASSAGYGLIAWLERKR